MHLAKSGGLKRNEMKREGLPSFWLFSRSASIRMILLAIEFQKYVTENKAKIYLKGSIEAGEAWKISLSGKDVQLSNKGGIITLLDQKGLKVDGVSYNKIL